MFMLYKCLLIAPPRPQNTLYPFVQTTHYMHAFTDTENQIKNAQRRSH